MIDVGWIDNGPHPGEDDLIAGPRQNGARYGSKTQDQGAASDTEEAPVPLETVRLSLFAGAPVPERQFLDQRQLMPMRQVTSLSGDGGTGKSLLALQLSVAVAMGRKWLDEDVKKGPVLIISAEDDLQEIHARAAEIAAAEGLDLEAMSGVEIVGLAGEDVELATETKRGRITKTPIYDRLLLNMEQLCPILLVIDNLADVFGGNENVRSQARQFIRLLRRIAIDFDCAVLLLAHPSLSGLNSGAGTSGSTGWSNSVRSRMFLRRETDAEGKEADERVRILQPMKSNYTALGEPIGLRWDCGVLVCTDKPVPIDEGIGKISKSERVFMKLMELYAKRGIELSAAPQARNFAPSVFFTGGEREGISKPALITAMLALLDQGKIKILPLGTGTRQKRVLTIATGD
ncbi:AAA family ATPase [Rhizobium sp. BK661]|uniref:AAA family ATPase n=1 Tax=Rhizobium sp. BK661 TaxID=2586991 RepID=UPI0021682FBF|nr:AAA family ATPase [Rhizobium sp. BK661]MCS3744311.1 hypothetical protein [Rhizobium sp. BK661]